MKNGNLMIFFLVLSFSFLVLFKLKDSVFQQVIFGILSKIFMVIAIIICSKELLWKRRKKERR